jgi:hypothetical protein
MGKKKLKTIEKDGIKITFDPEVMKPIDTERYCEMIKSWREQRIKFEYIEGDDELTKKINKFWFDYSPYVGTGGKQFLLDLREFVLQLLYQEKEKQYDKIVQILEKILGYCGIWHEDDIISVERKTGHGVSMTVKTFLELLKEEMVKNKKGHQK